MVREHMSREWVVYQSVEDPRAYLDSFMDIFEAACCKATYIVFYLIGIDFKNVSK